MLKHGFLGFGNLPFSLASGLVEATVMPTSEVIVFDKSEQAMRKAKDLGFDVALDFETLLCQGETLWLAVKPNVFRSLSNSFKASKKRYTRCVSVMAGITEAEIKEIVGVPVMRVIPTLAAAKGKDIIGICGTVFNDIKAMLDSIGSTFVCEEEKLPAITIAASCGLGFAAQVLESYKNAVKSLGFDEEQAVSITATTFSNAALFYPFSELAQKVATKGGVTEKGLAEMKERGLDTLFISAFEKAKH